MKFSSWEYSKRMENCAELLGVIGVLCFLADVAIDGITRICHNDW
jgi:hypothetical protein